MPTYLHSSRGSLLIGTAVLVAIFAIFMSGVLVYVSNEYRFNFRSHQYTQSLHLAEAAVEIGFTELQWQYCQGTNGFSTARGWVNLANGSYSNSVAAFTDTAGHIVGNLYILVNGVGTLQPTITGIGSATNTIGSLPPTVRAVNVILKTSSMFPVAIAAKGAIDMKGNNVTVDGFDSSMPSQSTAGRYDAAKKQPFGNIATDDAITNSDISVGNANIYGTVSTGPSGSVSLGAQGVIGPSFSNPATSVAAAMAAGWIRNDFSATFPDVTLPAGATAWPQQGPLNNTTLNTGSYQATGISPGNNQTLTINGNVTIYVTGDVNVKGQITVTAGSSLTVYCAGNLIIGGNGLVNNATSDASVLFYGLPTCTSVSLHGNADWAGAVYAPEAAFGLGGGGSSGDFQGALVAKTVTMNGHVEFHYDEALNNTPNLSLGYLATVWRELRLVGGVWQ